MLTTDRADIEVKGRGNGLKEILQVSETVWLKKLPFGRVVAGSRQFLSLNLSLT